MIKVNVGESKLEIEMKGTKSEILNDLMNIIADVIVSVSEGDEVQLQRMNTIICDSIEYACMSSENDPVRKAARIAQAPQ